MRSLPAQDIAGGQGGFGLFGFDSDPGVGVLGEDPDGAVAPARRQALSDALGVEIASARLGNIVAELLTMRGDPTGQAFAKPIMPDRDGLTLRFGTIARREAFDLKHPHAAKVLGVLREDWKRLVTEMPLERRRKVLGYWLRQYRESDPSKFIPAGYDVPEPLPPETTYSDDFNRADNLSLGANWTEVNTTNIQIASNAVGVSISGTVTWARYESDLSGSDHDCSIDNTAGTGNEWAGPVVRANASNQESYFFYARQGGNAHVFGKRSSTGTPTNIATSAASGSSAPYTGRLTMVGSIYTGYKAGSQVITGTDGSYSTGVRAGFDMRCANTSERNDNWTVTDIGAAPVASISFVRRRHTRIRARGTP